jgi:transcriptional regulator with XRE-family HTH domain
MRAVERLGTNLRRVRELRGMTQDDLANAAGVARSYVAALESGKRTNPGVATAYALARALRVTMETLLGAEALVVDSSAPSSDGDGYTLVDAQRELERRLLLIGANPFEPMTPAQMDAYVPRDMFDHADLIDAAELSVVNHLRAASGQPPEWIALSFYMSGVLAHLLKTRNSGA